MLAKSSYNMYTVQCTTYMYSFYRCSNLRYLGTVSQKKVYNFKTVGASTNSFTMVSKLQPGILTSSHKRIFAESPEFGTWLLNKQNCLQNSIIIFFMLEKTQVAILHCVSHIISWKLSSMEICQSKVLLPNLWRSVQ